MGASGGKGEIGGEGFMKDINLLCGWKRAKRKERWGGEDKAMFASKHCVLQSLRNQKKAPNKPGFVNVIDLNMELPPNAINRLGSKVLFYPLTLITSIIQE